MTPTPPERNNPGYTPYYKELRDARKLAHELARESEGRMKPCDMTLDMLSQQWLAAEVRLMRLEMRLERALER